jgi:hypothetical protein
MPENREAQVLINASMWQIRVTGMGDVLGFDLNAVQIVAKAHGITLTPSILAKLRAVEGVMCEKRG